MSLAKAQGVPSASAWIDGEAHRASREVSGTADETSRTRDARARVPVEPYPGRDETAPRRRRSAHNPATATTRTAAPGAPLPA